MKYKVYRIVEANNKAEAIQAVAEQVDKIQDLNGVFRVEEEEKALWQITVGDIYGVLVDDMELSNKKAEALLADKEFIKMLEQQLSNCISWGDAQEYIIGEIEDYIK